MVQALRSQDGARTTQANAERLFESFERLCRAGSTRTALSSKMFLARTNIAILLDFSFAAVKKKFQDI